jgi:hypothetical protein
VRVVSDALFVRARVFGVYPISRGGYRVYVSTSPAHSRLCAATITGEALSSVTACDARQLGINVQVLRLRRRPDGRYERAER